MLMILMYKEEVFFVQFFRKEEKSLKQFNLKYFINPELSPQIIYFSFFDKDIQDIGFVKFIFFFIRLFLFTKLLAFFVRLKLLVIFLIFLLLYSLSIFCDL